MFVSMLVTCCFLLICLAMTYFCSLWLGTVRRFIEKQKDKIHAVVFCTTTTSDTEIYKRLIDGTLTLSDLGMHMLFLADENVVFLVRCFEFGIPLLLIVDCFHYTFHEISTRRK